MSETRIEKALTYFFMPFYLDDAEESIETLSRKSGMWKLEEEKLNHEQKAETLHPYIMEFLQGKAHAGSQRLTVFALKNDDSEWGKSFFPKLADKSMVTLGKEASPVHFHIIRGNDANAPHLYFYGDAGIGFLSFCIEITAKELTLDVLQQFNYQMHKIAQPMCNCECGALTINERQRFKTEDDRSNREEALLRMWRYIHPTADNTWQPTDAFIWTMADLVDMLVGEVTGLHKFNASRLHLFTYCQFNETEAPKAVDGIAAETYRLARCVTDKYLICSEGSTMPLFENIIAAASLEGSAIVAVATERNRGFITQLHGNIRQRYLLIYLLVLVQRFTLKNIDRRLVKIENQELVAPQESDSELWKLLNAVKKVKLHCHFTEVSTFTQHTQFYRLCCRNMLVDEAFEEMQRKSEMARLTTGHVLEQQFKEAEEKERQRDHHTNRILYLLTLLAAGSTIYDLVNLVRSCEIPGANPADIIRYGSLVLIIALIIFLWRLGAWRYMK